MGVSAQFRVSSGFRVANASFEFGAESIDGGVPQLIRSANMDGGLIPLDFALSNGSQGYAFFAFGPHVMFWPWITGTGAVQRVLNLIAWSRPGQRLQIPFPVLNVHPALQIGTRFRFDPVASCINSAPEMGMSVWIWQDFAQGGSGGSDATNGGTFGTYQAQGITIGFA
jgi:hypothetical protein